jgi:DNA polymerase III subunit delta'
MPFRDVVGHVRLINLLSRSIAGSSLPPSLLFAGPSGIGKHLTAVGVAQALNCTAPVISHQSPVGSHQSPAAGQPPSVAGSQSSVDACGVCAACTRIARGVHPDVLLVSPGDNGSIKIDQVRDLVDRAQYRPFEGRRRVVIIDEADALVPPAQNALLKTLEEPTPSSVFILVTARPDMLLPTVLSRCPQLRFRPLSLEEMAAALIARGRTDTEARAVAATADGSLGQALQASAVEFLESRELAQQVLEKAAAQHDPARRVETAQQLITKPPSGMTEREQLATHLRAMAVLLRDVEVVATGADQRTLANADVRPALERLSTTYRGERGARAFAAVDRALAALQRNAGVKLVADWLVLQL